MIVSYILFYLYNSTQSPGNTLCLLKTVRVCGARNGVYSYLFILMETIICHSVQELGIRIQAEWCIKAITALRGDSDVWKAMDYVRIMVANDLSPDDAVISKLVSSFSRVGQAVKATDLVRWAQVKPLYIFVYIICMQLKRT